MREKEYFSEVELRYMEAFYIKKENEKELNLIILLIKIILSLSFYLIGLVVGLSISKYGLIL
jgi:hypothetical protein